MKLLSLFLLLSICFWSNAQTIITYEDHCYKENAQYVYHMVKPVSEGASGENQIWDFSQLKALDVLDGEMNVENYAIRNDLFPKGDISIEEFGNRFVFETSEQEIRQLGYISKDEKSITTYQKSPIKLKFPMQFSEGFSGEVAMKTNNTGRIKNGTYDVLADAYGTLILPGNVVFKDALRVKSQTDYESENGSIQTQIVFRWYVQSERFPVMVLQQTTFTTSNGTVSSSEKAAYKSISPKSAQLEIQQAFQISPNPAKAFMDIRYQLTEESEVTLDIFSLDGRMLDHIYKGTMEEGNHHVKYDINADQIVSGAYVVKLKTNAEVFTQQVIIQQ